MAFFRKDSETKTPVEQAQEEIMEFPLEVLWSDEEQSSLLTYVPHAVEIVLLIWILVKVLGLK